MAPTRVISKFERPLALEKLTARTDLQKALNCSKFQGSTGVGFFCCCKIQFRFI